MGERTEELGSDTTIALVTFTESANLGPYRQKNRLPYQMLVDPDRRAYRSFGLGRGRVGRVWGWQAGQRYVDILRTDGLRAGLGKLQRPVEDTLQLGGDFIVGPDGTLEFGYWGEGPDDRPSVDRLIAALRS